MKLKLVVFSCVLAIGAVAFGQEKTSGQGDWVFKFRPDLSKIPADAEPHIRSAHGGFAVDRQGAGDVYFHLNGYGIIHLSPDLATVSKIEGDEALTKGNGHNTSLGYNDKKEPYLVIPDNRQGKVFFTDTKGKVLHELGKPDALDWFIGERFVPTDTLVVGKQLLVADGYGSKYIFPAEVFGDYVKGIYGGKRVFTTSHGLDFNPVTKQIAIADREASQIRYFDQKGNEIKKDKKAVVTKLPAGARPCDVDYMPDGTAIVGCLRGEGNAPGEVYILDPEGNVLSCVKPKVDLGLSEGNINVEHVHNASWTKVGDKVYLLVYAWNPGGFAVLEQVKK
ncbi:MAG: hypothetical protein AAF226_05365 [Verrucomicrobiota bacterium]